MRNLRELLEMSGDTEEEDLPLIYNIVKRKIESGQKVMLAFQTQSCFYQVQSLSFSRAGWLADDEADENEKVIVLGYLAIPKDLEAGIISSPDFTDFQPDDLDGWKLSKKNDHWELQT